MNRKEITFSTNENGCHICTSHCSDGKGYPTIYRNKRHQRMSRYLWEQKYGPILEGLCVLHKCDTPACINVNHFFLGTQIDNMNDMIKKNRIFLAEGEKSGKAKLTKEQVLQIRQESGTLKEIAKKYDVTFANIGKIKNRKIWKCLDKES